MENQLRASDDFFKKLFNGENVVCPQCEKGTMVPVNSNVDPSKNHTYYCPVCNAIAHWDPVVIVE